MSTAAKRSAPVTNPLFDKKLINAFVDGVIKTLQEMTNTKVIPGKPVVETKRPSKGEVAGIIGMVSGGFKGTLLLSFTKECAIQILENMLGEKHNEIGPEVTDAIGELTNIIYGSAKITLNENGYAFEMSLPTVVVGNFLIANHHAGIDLSIPFSIDDNKKFFIELSVDV